MTVIVCASHPMDIDMPPAWVSHDHWHARVLSEYPLLSSTATRRIEILKCTKPTQLDAMGQGPGSARFSGIGPLACTEALSGCPVSHESNTETDASSTPLVTDMDTVQLCE